MTRSAYISSGGDPFITLTVLKLWKKYWYDEIDEMYINYNNHSEVPQEVVSEFLARASNDKKVHLIYHPRGIGNGLPINEMVQISHEDLILLLEDDAFIFTPGAVNRCFQQIESDLTDIVGSPRRSCGTEIWDRSKEKYNLDYSGYGDMGPNWWPNFFFCKRSDILKTDMDFGSSSFKPGDYSKELDYTFKEQNYGDTFVKECMQLRALGLRSQSVPQHHASPTEFEDRANGEQNWHPTQQPFEWIHAGSLSSGWNGYLNRLLPDTSTDIAKQEIETRVSFWKICLEEIDGFNNFRIEYSKGIDNLIQKCNLDVNRINKKVEIYKGLMKI